MEQPETETETETKPETVLEWVLGILGDEQGDAGLIVDELEATELAEVFAALPPPLHARLWDAVPEERQGEVLGELDDASRDQVVQEMSEDNLASTAGQLDPVDLAEIITELPQAQSEAVLARLDEDLKERLNAVLAYDEDTAGRLMHLDALSVRADVTLAVVTRWLRRIGSLPDATTELGVVDDDRRYLGSLHLSDIIVGDGETLVAEVLRPGITVKGTLPEDDVVDLFRRRELVEVHVLDEEGRLQGRILVEDVMDLIDEEADQQVRRQAGLSDNEALFSPIAASIRSRSVWLGINLLTVLLASWAISQFEEALAAIVALAVLMPIVASMGGIAGSQTLTMVVRGIALQRFAGSNTSWLTRKELIIGIANGLLWAAVMAMVAFAWFGDPKLGLIIAGAMLINLVTAGLMGVLVPFLLDRLSIDPALSGAVVLTTITDIVGFVAFLGLATVFLL